MHYGDVDAYDLNHDGIKYTDTDQASRKIYQISSHTDPWYDRTEDEKRGTQKSIAENTYYPKSQQEIIIGKSLHICIYGICPASLQQGSFGCFRYFTRCSIFLECLPVQLPGNNGFRSFIQPVINSIIVRAQGTNGGFGSSSSAWIGISDNTGKGYDAELPSKVLL